MIESQHEASVHFDAGRTKDSDAPLVVLGKRRFFPRFNQIHSLQRFEAHEDSGAAGKRHFTDHLGTIRQIQRHSRAPDLLERREAAAQTAHVIRAGAEIIVKEYRVMLRAGTQLGGHILRQALLIGHLETMSREIAEPAAVAAAPRSDKTRRSEKRCGRDILSPGRRFGGEIVAV